MSQMTAKIQRRIELLAALRYRDTRPITPIVATRLQIGTDPEGPVPAAPADPVALQQGDRWGERDAIYDMRFGVAIPPEWRGQTLALHLDLSAPPQGWEIATVEGIFYLDGKPFHALDRYHREIVLGAEMTERDTLEGTVRLWTGINEPEHTLHATELRLLDEPTDQLYLRLRQVLDALNQLPDTSPTRIALIAALDDVCRQLDLRDPRSPDAYASYRAALMLLEERLHDVELPQITWQPHAIAVGHAHIDVAWLWQLRHTRMKAANTFTTALYHMDRYPHFTFMQSTPQLYEFVKEDHPEIYERIKARVSSGQWEAEGATWVEADTNITGGESLVRQFLFGQRFFRQEFGHTCKVLWLPDVFGYSAVLPQLIKAAGAQYFVTTKISWSDTNRMPVDTFWWEGLDGTRVLTHFITARNNASDRYATYNAEMKPGVPALTWKDYRQQDINRELLIAYGNGDGGGGPTREWIEAAGNWSMPLSRDLPTVTTGTVADFMERLEQRVGENPDLPRWVGELYLEYHRGTYTSQAHTKRNNRLAERDLHNAEWLASLAQILAGQPYPYDDLHGAWKTVLTHQFHDIIPGSSIGPVYADAEVNYAGVRAITDDVIATSLQTLADAVAAPQGSLITFNPTGWQRDDLIVLETEQAKAMPLPQQSLPDGRVLARVSDVPALGYTIIMPDAETVAIPENELIATPTLLENRFLRVELNERGQITRIFDKAAYGGAGREVMRAGERANVFQLFEDRPLNFDAWDIDAFYEEKSWELDHLAGVEVVEQGPLRAGLRLRWEYRDRTTITQTMYLTAEARRLDFVTEVDWHERQTLLKVAFPVDIHNGQATAEIQFGTIMRPTHRNTSWDRARFETCGHKWIDLSEGDYGVALLNDCKYGYDIHDHTLRQTLLKGAISPDPDADVGHHQFTYSLRPHEGDWFTEGVHREAYALNYPLLVAAKTGDSQGAAPTTCSLAESSAPHVVVETAKRAEDGDGLILRAYECANRRGPFQLRLPFVARRVVETNLLEEGDSPVTLSPDGQTIQSTIRPYEIKTLLVERD